MNTLARQLAAGARAASPRRVAVALVAALVALLLLGLAAGAEGLSSAWVAEAALIADIRAPRTVGAALAGALLGLAGALSQGLFRNPLADPYLLGTAAGSGLAVTLVLSVGGLLGAADGLGLVASGWLARLGVSGAAFAGALGGLALTLLMARGSARPLTLLLAGVVVGVLLTALGDLLVLAKPEALRGQRVFMIGTTSFLGWGAVVALACGLMVALPSAMLLARVLDALVLGEASAASLGLPLARLRLVLVGLLALATGCAVAQVGLVAWVGRVAPHLVRRLVVVRHGALLALSSLAGAVLLLAADVASRLAVAPQELPVGVLTAVFGGIYLLALLRRRGAAS
jgi:iron complex transport system permease protein